MAREQLFPNNSPLERINLLEGICDGVSIETYEVPLDHEAETALKDRVVDLSVQKSVIEKRKARLEKEIKKELKPINEELGESINILHRGTEIKDGKIYKVIEGRTVKLYDADGYFVSSRPLRPEEHQMVIKDTNINKVSNQ